jgi:cytochrome oxidase Cu insertion factor (SCO1/SenC/PrrC family)
MKMKAGIALLCFAVLLFASVPTPAAAHQGSAPPIGLNIGQPAPAFTLADQFGHEQSASTLKGSKGTILLFFRSADW